MAVTDIQPFVHMDQFSSFSVSQEPPISFYPLDATTWDFPSSFVADSAHSTFSDAVWEVPAMEVDFPSTVMPIMSLESIKSSQTSTTTSGSMEPSVSEPFSPPSRSRSQSRERDDITRKQRRRQQNRKAQQAYRMRKDQQISLMEQELCQLRDAHQQLQKDHQALLNQLAALKIPRS